MIKKYRLLKKAYTIQIYKISIGMHLISSCYSSALIGSFLGPAEYSVIAIISVTANAAETVEVSEGSVISVIAVTAKVAKNVVIAEHSVISVTPEAAERLVMEYKV